MRYNIQGVARSSYGIILPFYNVNVYINGTDTSAIVYDSKTSTVKKSTIKTEEDGLFQIYFDSDDYEYLDITFDLEIDGERYKDIEVFKIDKRILNTNEEIAEENIKEVINNNVLNIDGGTF